ncbi:MAG: DUF697 domain-containing protein [Devosia sp.]
MTAAQMDEDAHASQSAMPTDPAKDDSDRPERARKVINRHAAYGAAGGLIPIPIVDIAAASTIQMRMISQLADVYDIRFSEQLVKSTVASLVTSVVPQAGVGYTTLSAVRVVPVIGTALSMATFPALYGALTYALGRTFAWHFANGGTLEDLKVSDLKDHFKSEFRSASKDKDKASADPLTTDATATATS